MQAEKGIDARFFKVRENVLLPIDKRRILRIMRYVMHL